MENDRLSERDDRVTMGSQGGTGEVFFFNEIRFLRMVYPQVP